jgi:hypothetical protein
MAGKVGRPRTHKDWARVPGYSVRLTPEERAPIEDAIARSGLKKSEWLRKCLLYIVSRDIRIT